MTRTSRWFIVTNLCFLSVFASPSHAQASKARAEWTILVFMNADNDLEKFGLRNFDQIAKVGSTDKVNVLVQFDRIPGFSSTTPDWSQTLRFRVTKDMKAQPTSAGADLGEVNMGSGEALSDFVRWGQQEWPANRYMLIIWDHGQGWRKMVASLLARNRTLQTDNKYLDSVKSGKQPWGTLRGASAPAGPEGEEISLFFAPRPPYRSSSHDQTDKDALYNREAQDALSAVLKDTPLDVIGFDACLMSMVEAAYSMRNVAKYLVGSEELEPGDGWRYDSWLSALVANPTQDGASLAKLTVESYRQTYTSPGHEDPETTLSAFDLSKISDLTTALSALSEKLTNSLDTHLQSLIEARSSVLEFAPGWGFHHVDLGLFLEKLGSRNVDGETKSRIDATRKALEAGVIANYAGSSRQDGFGSTGLAIYFPSSLNAYVTDPLHENGYEKDNNHYPVEFVQKEKWANFLHAYFKRVPY